MKSLLLDYELNLAKIGIEPQSAPMKIYSSKCTALLVMILLCNAPGVFSVTESAASQLTAQERDLLVTEITARYDKADAGSRWWSVSFHGCLFLSAAASAAAALILKLDQLKNKLWQKDLAACLAALAAVLPLISTSGSFNQKWITNRATRAALSDLLLEIKLAADNPSPAASDFARRFRDIMSQHERGIAPSGERPRATTKTASASSTEKVSP